MQVKVLNVRRDSKGNAIAHVQIGSMFGDVLATDEVTEPGEYFLKSTLRVRDGRIIPLIRVEKP